MSKAIARAKKAERALAEVPVEQREALLQSAGIGQAAQARALASSFRMLEQAVYAEDQIRVGSGKSGRMIKRPNWEARISASRTLLEWLAPVVKRVNAGPSGRTVVNVVTAPYAQGVDDGMQRAHAVIIDAESTRLDSDAE